VALTDVEVERDLFYFGGREEGANLPESGKPIRLGPDDHFMLGDNTRSSSDSRRWTAAGIRLRDGTRVWWDSQTSPQYVDQGGVHWNEVTDVEGIVRRWRDEDKDPGVYRENERRPFVHRDQIVGKAFFALVFWPLDGEFWKRLRFVH
jgi:hypothetical protein